MKVEVLNMADRVKHLLTTRPHLRDDDNKLIANIYHGDFISLGYKPESISCFQALEVLSKGLLSNTESITRARRKVQEEFPELRGKSYTNRQENTTKIIEQIREY